MDGVDGWEVVNGGRTGMDSLGGGMDGWNVDAAMSGCLRVDDSGGYIRLDGTWHCDVDGCGTEGGFWGGVLRVYD